MSYIKISPTQEEIDYLKQRFEDHYTTIYLRTISGSMIVSNDNSKNTREYEAKIFFGHVLDSFRKNEKTTSREELVKEFDTHMNFKIQLAKKKSSR